MALRLTLTLEFDFALHFSSFHFNPFSGISLHFHFVPHFGSAVPLGIALFKNLRLFMERINFGRIFLCHFTRQSIKMGTHTLAHTCRSRLWLRVRVQAPMWHMWQHTKTHRRHRRRGHGHGRAANKMKYINFATI